MDHAQQRNGSQYLSNACIHEQHVDCDKECSYCGDACRCVCHVEEPRINVLMTEAEYRDWIGAQ